VTPHQILIVAIRLLAIFWFLGVLAQLPTVLVTMQEMRGVASSFWLSPLLQLLVCAFLWLFPATLASKLLRSGSEPIPASSVPFSDWRDLLFIVVGVFVLARAVPDAIYWIALGVASEPLVPDLTFEQKVSVFATVLELVIGVALTLGAKGVGNSIERLRRAGQQRGASA
jgi:hypothetical protein